MASSQLAGDPCLSENSSEGDEHGLASPARKVSLVALGRYQVVGWGGVGLGWVGLFSVLFVCLVGEGKRGGRRQYPR